MKTKKMTTVFMTAVLAACLSTLEAAVGTSDWFPVDTTEKADFIVRYHGNGGLVNGQSVVDEGFSFGEHKTMTDMSFARGGNEFLGWQTGDTHYRPGAQPLEYKCYGRGADFNLLQEGLRYLSSEGAVTEEDGVSVLHLYAIWTTSVRYDFHNEEDGTLKPDSLADKIWWRRSDEESSVKHMGGEFVEVPPGTWTVRFGIADGIDWFISAPQTEALTIPSDVSGDSLTPIDGVLRRTKYERRDVSVKDKNQFGANVRFVCHAESAASLGGTAASAFDDKRVSISLEYWIGENKYGQSLGSFKPWKVYTLPKGTCVVKFSYDNGNASGDGWQAVMPSSTYAFDGSSPNSLRTIDVNFWWRGSGIYDRGAKLVMLDADGGTCGVDRMNYPWAVGDTTRATFVVNYLPTARKDDYRFVGWKIKGGASVSEGQEVSSSVSEFVAQYEPLTLGAVVRDIVGGTLSFLSAGGAKTVSVPASVTAVTADAFVGRQGIKTIVFEGDAPDVEDGAFIGFENCEILVSKDSTGWGDVPGKWNGIRVEYASPDIELPEGYGVYSDGLYTWVWQRAGDGAEVTGFSTSSGDRPGVYPAPCGSVTIPAEIRVNETESLPVIGLGDNLFKACTNLTDVVIPDTVQWIWTDVFADTALESVNVPADLVIVQSSAFEGTPWLYGQGDWAIFGDFLVAYVGDGLDVSIPDGVYAICSDAFYGSNVRRVNIPDSVEVLHSWAFEGSRNLLSVTGGRNIKAIGENGFKDTAIWEYAANNAPVCVGSWLVGCKGKAKGTVTVPDGVTFISEYAFYDQSGMTAVRLPGTLNRIGSCAFCGTGLTGVVIPASVTEIGDGAFDYCPNLKLVTIMGNLDEECSNVIGTVDEEDENSLSSDLVVRMTSAWTGDAEMTQRQIGTFAIGAIFPSDLRTVNFNSNGGAVAEVSRLAVTGTELGVPPVPVRKGYAFAGWWTAKKGGSQVSAATKITKDVTCYARWTVAVTVTLNANGGALYEKNKISVGKGMAVGGLPRADKVGKDFEGWYTKKSGGTKVTAKTKLTKNTTLYAHFGPLKYKVYAADEIEGGSISGLGRYAKGKTVTVKAVPKKGYVFVGWSDNGWISNYDAKWRQSSISFKMPAEDVEFAAEFRPASEDETPGMYLSEAGEWHLEWGVDLSISIDSLSYAKVTTSKLPKGIKLSSVAGTDSEFVLKATKDASKLAPGAYPITITATNRAGRKTVHKIVMFAKNLTAAAGLIEGLDTSTNGGYEFEAGVKCSDDLDISLRRTWSIKSITGLPPGLKVNTKNFRVTGVPSKAGNYAVTFAVICKGKKVYKASATFKVRSLNTNVAGTFSGATRCADPGGAEGAELSRKISLTAASNGKITAKVGDITLTGTGWKDEWLEEDDPDDWHEAYTATLKATRKVGKKTYTDVLYVAVDPEAPWTVDQASGTFKTYLGTKITDSSVPINDDEVFIARHNPFARIAEAKTVAAKLAALGPHYVTLNNLEWKVIVGIDGVAKISRTTGTGKNQKVVSASSVVSVDAAKDDNGRYEANAVFFVGGQHYIVVYDVDESGATMRRN